MDEEQLKELLRSNQRVIILAAVAIVLGFLLMFLGGEALSAYNNYQAKTEEVTKMTHEVSEFQQQDAFLKNQPLRPIPEEQVPAVQGELLLLAQAHHLQLDSSQADPSSKGTYSMKLTGTYADTVAFLRGFGSGDALVNLLTISMQPKNGLIETNLSYRVYSNTIQKKDDKQGKAEGGAKQNGTNTKVQ